MRHCVSACNVDLVQRIEISRITLEKKTASIVLTFHSKEVFIEETAEDELDEPAAEGRAEVEALPAAVADDDDED